MIIIHSYVTGFYIISDLDYMVARYRVIPITITNDSIWDQIQAIKAMPIPMDKKRERKNKLLVRSQIKDSLTWFVWSGVVLCVVVLSITCRGRVE